MAIVWVSFSYHQLFWSSAEADGPPPYIWFGTQDCWHHTHQGGMKKLIIYIMEVSGESRAGPKWLERARKGDWHGLSLWLESGAGWMFLQAAKGAMIWVPYQHQGDGTQRLFQLAKMWGRGEGMVRLNSCQNSNIKNGLRFCYTLPTHKHQMLPHMGSSNLNLDVTIPFPPFNPHAQTPSPFPPCPWIKVSMRNFAFHAQVWLSPFP